MRAFYFPCVPDSGWLEGVLPGVGPAEAPVAGRKFIDWTLEAAGRFGVDSAVLVDKRISPELEHRFAIDRDGLCAVSTMRLAKGLPRSLSEVIASPWFRGIAEADSSVTVLWGNALPFYDVAAAKYEPVPEPLLGETPAGIYHWCGGKWLRPAAGAAAMRDAASWLDISMRLLEGEGSYTLPGYSAEKGVYICRNVVMELGTEVHKPVMLLDDAWCSRNVRLERAVVGAGAFVGEGAKLVRTMVCDGTFVGEGLDLEGKIVAGGRVIYAATGTWVDIEESGMVRGVSRAPRWVRAIGRFLAGSSFRRRP